MSLFAELKRRNVIRVALFYGVSSWLILQVGDVVFGLMGIPGWGLRLVFGILLLGFPIALILSWVYELTPEGLKRESDIDRSESITNQTGRKLDIAVIVVVIAGIVVALSDRVGPSGSVKGSGSITADAGSAIEPDPFTEEVSIAVLPFRDMSAAGDQDYFAEGIAEELLNALVRVEGLRVASRTSSFSYKDKDLNLPTIARELNVSHVLEGSIRTAGNQIRVTAQLIDVSRDSHLWSETFDRTLDDIFAIQDEITEQVLDKLVAYLGQTDAESSTQTLTSNAEAYRLYLQGRHLWRQRSAEELRQSIELFKRALELDPEFAQAWSNLAAAYFVLPIYDPETPEGSYDEAMIESADRALALKPDLAETVALKANALQRSCDWVGSERGFRRALEIGPKDPSTRHWYALMLLYAGRIDAAREQGELAYQLDPLNAAIVSTLGDVEIVAGNVPRTIKLWEEAADLGFDDGNLWSVGYAMVLGGDSVGGGQLMLEETAFQSSGPEPELAEAFLAALEDPAKSGPLEARTVAALEAGRIGMYTATMLLAPVNSGALIEIVDDRALCWDASPMPWMPQASRIRRDPEFFEAYRETGFVEYWREFGWPDRCEELDPELAECD